MAKVELIAKRAGRYPKKVLVGERFSASRTNARILIAVGAAEAAPPLPPPVVAPKKITRAQIYGTESSDAPKSPRQYVRRDLKAED